jgi:hypothetical protein
MRRYSLLAAVIVTLSTWAMAPSNAEAGCYRAGLGGWYDTCFGPLFLYPHHRVCRHGHCWSR